ncbi:Fe-S cluster assembly protein SufD [Chloroflexus sp.]|uniref:Fe-S cluster assembly protein SufD n=1 Tax=Chloroflexus sp. TaxID=1904827 RepID=UPI00298F0006|nr:Fe-S cluster assembly protein SufD [Chloroflexus sp.]MCS6888054.1 Fe-S cluster assembly protein SufD [Chloroflexus sp.]MDW8402751.1 Fe-S cluster assembly protein SufD [Chloroflexus sp.]
MTTTLPTLNEFSAEMVVARSQAANEPAWLTERRREAWAAFAQMNPPEWRRTDLSKLDPATIAPSDGVHSTAIQWDPALAAQGVIFTTLAAALHTHEALIQKYMDTAVEPLKHKFSALRAALWQDGALLYVPKGVAIEAPLRLIYTLAADGTAIFPRTLVIVEPQASVTFIEEFTSPDLRAGSFAGPITELFVGDGASVRFISIQHWGSGVYHLGGQRAILARDANLEWTSIQLGGQVQHIEAETTLVGNGSRLNWLGATFAADTQHLVIAPWMRHVGHNCESFMQFKTVVNDTAYSVFDGMIKIEHESAATSTRLEEHALHLSPKARNDSIPGLMISTNDVLKGGHASTSGDIDQEQLFYMQTRGIPRAEAQRMIVMGFFEPALETVPLEELRAELTAEIAAKI